MKVKDRFEEGRYLVANTTRRPGWNVYTVSKDQSDTPKDRVKVIYIRDGLREITIPKSTAYISTSCISAAKEACIAMDAAEDTESRAISAAAGAKFQTKKLVQRIYEY